MRTRQDVASLDQRSSKIDSILFSIGIGLLGGLSYSYFADVTELVQFYALALIALLVVSLTITFCFDSSKKGLQKEMFRLIAEYGIENGNEHTVLVGPAKVTSKGSVFLFDSEPKNSLKIGFNIDGKLSIREIDLKGAELILCEGVVFKEFNP
jgi:hypothetical protein